MPEVRVNSVRNYSLHSASQRAARIVDESSAVRK